MNADRLRCWGTGHAWIVLAHGPRTASLVCSRCPAEHSDVPLSPAYERAPTFDGADWPARTSPHHPRESVLALLTALTYGDPSSAALLHEVGGEPLAVLDLGFQTLRLLAPKARGLPEAVADLALNSAATGHES